MKVKKRNGKFVPFDGSKISAAIQKAFLSLDKTVSKDILDAIVSSISLQDGISIEDIQDQVVGLLHKNNFSDVAVAYREYRARQAMQRELKTTEIFTSIIQAEANDITRENANMNASSPAGMMMKFASTSSSNFASRHLISKNFAEEMENNYIHIHDKDYYPSRSTTCVTGNTKIEIKIETNDSIQYKTIEVQELDRYFNSKSCIHTQFTVPTEIVSVLGRNSWTRITSISRRVMDKNDKLFTIKTKYGDLHITGSHIVPIHSSQNFSLKKVQELRLNDKLFSPKFLDYKQGNTEYINVLNLIKENDGDKYITLIIENKQPLIDWVNKNLNFAITQKYELESRLSADKFIEFINIYEIPYDVLNKLHIYDPIYKTIFPIFLPVTPQLSYILGYMSNVYEDENNILTFRNAVGARDFKETIENIFPIKLTEFSYNNWKGYMLESYAYVTLLKYLNKSIPSEVLNGNHENRWNYLNGVFHLTKKSKGGKFTLNSPEWALRAFTLLQSMNIKVKIDYDPNNLVISESEAAKILDNYNLVIERVINKIYAHTPSKTMICELVDIESLTEYKYTEPPIVYDLETVEHWWTANNIVVHNCLQTPLDKILSKGFKSGHGESRAAKRIETAATLACISLETTQNEQHGGQAIPAFDYYLAPYVKSTYIEELQRLKELFDSEDVESLLKNPKVDEYTFIPLKDLKGLERIKQAAINTAVKRIHQAMEGFIHNMNQIHSRGGNQVVFSSINYGTDTSAEGRCIIRELLLSTERGVGNGITPIFPIQIFKLKNGISHLPEDKNYDLYKLSCRVSAKRFFPNFLNLDSSFNYDENWKIEDPKRYMSEVSTMGCRTRVYENRHGQKTSVGRGNLSFTTINFPKLAIETVLENGGTIKDGELIKTEIDHIPYFIEKVLSYVDTVAKQLYERYEFQCEAYKTQFPFLMSGLWKDSDKLKSSDKVKSVLKHGTLGIGFIGLAEALVALTGKHHGESEEQQKQGLAIITAMRDRVKYWADYYDLNYSVLATPAEGLSGKFTKKDKKKYGILKGITDREYYTNSNHVPVYYNCSAKHKAEVECPYHKLTLGGHIFYVELDGDPYKNSESLMDVVELAIQNDGGYVSINHFQSRCPICNYETTEKDIKQCPHGHGELETIQRITGYLVGSTAKWNSGKLGELNDRVQHSCTY